MITSELTFNSLLWKVERITDSDIWEHYLIQICPGRDFAQYGLILDKGWCPLHHIDRDEGKAGQGKKEDKSLQNFALKVVEPAEAMDAACVAHELGPFEHEGTQRGTIFHYFWYLLKQSLIRMGEQLFFHCQSVNFGVGTITILFEAFLQLRLQ